MRAGQHRLSALCLSQAQCVSVCVLWALRARVYLLMYLFQGI
jgi:hypothetical protein